PVVRQSDRAEAYQAALDRLVNAGMAYPCACSRRDIEQAMAATGRPHERHHAQVYPGTCRPERGGLRGRPARAWRLRLPDPPESVVHWTDRRLGPLSQDVGVEVGDFVLRRADGLWAYQLAVVVDDAHQGITDVVRGEDLADNTPRQVLLQKALGLITPRYLHTPLVLAEDGQKLSKQNGAQALDLTQPEQALRQAAARLGLPPREGTCSSLLAAWTDDWRNRHAMADVNVTRAG
ncbi:MAG: tRNA glutamyl-Q(34) synthetase GluQRS, partial [Burkholderiales bacterium]